MAAHDCRKEQHHRMTKRDIYIYTHKDFSSVQKEHIYTYIYVYLSQARSTVLCNKTYASSFNLGKIY